MEMERKVKPMKKTKKLLTLLLAVVMLLTAAPAAFAAVNDTGFSDVSADAWYADAVQYVRDHDVMNGTTATTFSPDETVTRGMLAAVIYGIAGRPAVTGTDAFTDTAADAYYSKAVVWASKNGIVSGYGNGLFGTNDPVSRQQMATILWKYAGSPSVDEGEDFADKSAIAAYAATAVKWARAEGIINGETGNRFDPDGNTTRAQAAAILHSYMTKGKSDDEPAGTGSNTLVVYFSATGSTEEAAKTIAEKLGADLFELVPQNPYTSGDLNWTVDGSRVNLEHDNPSKRTVELTADTVENWASYDTVFIGYPIWWGIAAWPVDGFIAANDFTGKTVIPFCTSTSSGLGQSGQLLAEAAGTGDWMEGHRFSSGAAESEVEEWIGGLNLKAKAPAK